MELAPERVRELVEAEDDRRELEGFKCDSIPVQRTRAVIADALARDPDLTIGEIARWLEMRQVDFERAFLGKGRNGRPKRRVNVCERESADDRARPSTERAPRLLSGLDYAVWSERDSRSPSPYL